MSTVYVKNITAFDAANEHTIIFGYSGNQCTKNRIIVYNSATNASVYDNTVTTYNLAHVIPAGTLTNGTSYYVTITAYYLVNNVENSVVSSASNVFKCLSTATWALNINNGATIGNSYFTFQITYLQAENDPINEFNFAVYNSSGTEFWISDTLYNATDSATVTGLLNDTQYFVRAYGTTASGLVLDTRTTADISVVTSYTAPTIYAYAYLTNERYQGFVKVDTNIASVDGKSSATPSFITDSAGTQYIDLSANGASVTFDNGFSSGDDFTMMMDFYGVRYQVPVITLKSETDSYSMSFYQTTNSTGSVAYAQLKDDNGDYRILSNYISIPTSKSKIFVYIKRENGLFFIRIENLGEVTP